MRRSTGGAPSRALRRAVTWLLPLLAAAVLATPAQAGVRSQAAGAQAIAGVLSQATGLTPSQVTSEAACGQARPGFAQCDAQALVLSSSHARVRPHVHGGPTFTQVFPSGRHAIPSVRPANNAATGPQPDTPAWLQQAYDLTYLSQTGGTGDTVAVVDVGDDPTAESDLAVFRSTYGLPACSSASGCFEKVNETGGTSPLPAPDPTWEPEESLDLDAVSSLCPNCHILLVEASTASIGDLDKAVVEAAHLHANQISNSWSEASGTAIQGQYTFPGVAVIAATGDSGYMGGGADAYPAAFPGVTAAGGTSLAAATAGQSARGFSESAWSLFDGWGATSGCDLNEPKPSYQLDSGCNGRAYSDLSADADPDTGLMIYDAGNWWQYGGTSLATPLIAAYEAVTGVSGATPQWAYTDSALLNDPTGGSSGDCPPNIIYICDAGPGYDGPTGIGSISGAVVAGAPGIGGPTYGDTYTQGVGATTAALSGGVYPNGLDTTYYWQYGTTTSYGAQTGPVDIGAGQAPVAVTGALSGLAPGTVYHYRLVAQNSRGVMYGYDSELTTEPAPVNTAVPSIGGSALTGHTLTAYPGGWTPNGNSLTYQWQRSSNGSGWTNIGGANGGVYTIGPGDGGDQLRLVVTANNAYGQATVASGAVGPVVAGYDSSMAPGGPRSTTRPRISVDRGRVGDTLTIVQARWAGSPRRKVTQLMRCTNVCVPVGASNATRYTITEADVGSVLRVRETARNRAGSAVVWSAGSVGPVVSLSSAAVVPSGRRSALRNSRGAALAFARISAPAPSVDSVPEQGVNAAPAQARIRVLVLHRARGVRGQVTAWVCAVAGAASGAPPRCTARIALGAQASVELPGSITGRVRVVVVRR
ncbi:MAG TPA: hypothetical protein VMA76_01620 [Solirubrobacteraceae bacterium]|nr:hypothetical protein [Solirubrobacteraceae bacterium]